MSAVTPLQVKELFGGLVSSAPLWFDSVSGVVSVNTQARRLGCLLYLLGKVAAGRKMQSLLVSLPASELADLKTNLEDNRYSSGYLTSKASSIEHYLNVATEFRLLAKQGSLFGLTNRGKFLMDAVQPASSQPYPMPLAAKVFFFNSILTTDYFGVAAVVSSLLQGARKLIDAQKSHQSELLRLLNSATRSSSDSRLHRMAQDRIISIRKWTKPESYAEHLVSAKINWLMDLGIVRLAPNSSLELELVQEHAGWITEFCNTFTPTEAHIAAYTLNYATAGSTEESKEDTHDICDLLHSAFSRLARHSALIKVRCTDLVLFLLCFHAASLSTRIAKHKRLISESDIECGEWIYKIHLAARSTQSFVVRSQRPIEYS
jgi:hypothetical protein